MKEGREGWKGEWGKLIEEGRGQPQLQDIGGMKQVPHVDL